jgi:hypothetical protein
VGKYRVVFPGLASEGGNVQVTAYGLDTARCKAESWTGRPNGDLHVNVRCHTRQGVLTDSQFTASYYVADSPGDLGAFVWINGERPDVPKDPLGRTPAIPQYSWNSTGQINKFERNSLGSYTVYLPGFVQSANRGNVLVTATGVGAEHCKVENWFEFATRLDGDRVIVDARVNVECYAANGSHADSGFSLSYVKHGVPAPFNWGAYALADRSTEAAYTPAKEYAFTSSAFIAGISADQTVPQATRFTRGHYMMRYPQMPARDKTTAHVVAHGTGPGYCKLRRWSESDHGTNVETFCFSHIGSLSDEDYLQRYAFNGLKFLAD